MRANKCGAVAERQRKIRDEGGSMGEKCYDQTERVRQEQGGSWRVHGGMFKGRLISHAEFLEESGYGPFQGRHSA
ncbi:hypothetical protein MHYP_G00095040 [Metynnis hypsauchen]